MDTLFLDLETTGLNPLTDGIVEIAIVDQAGGVVLNQLVNPGLPIPRRASAVHGITDDDVAGAPSVATVWSEVRPILEGCRVVIYNASFDKRFFPGDLGWAGDVQCAMQAFRQYMRNSEPNC